MNLYALYGLESKNKFGNFRNVLNQKDDHS